MTVEEVRERLRARIAETGGQAAFAREYGVSTVYLQDAVTGRRSPGPAILAALGLEKETRVDYREAARG